MNSDFVGQFSEGKLGNWPKGDGPNLAVKSVILGRHLHWICFFFCAVEFSSYTDFTATVCDTTEN